MSDGRVLVEAEVRERAERFKSDVQLAREQLADGAVEKYPAAKAVVRILDAEAIYDAFVAQREVVAAARKIASGEVAAVIETATLNELTDALAALGRVHEQETA